MAKIEFVPKNCVKTSTKNLQKAKVTEFPSSAPTSAISSSKNARNEEQRKGLIAKIHVAKSQLSTRLEGFDDIAYRAILENNFNTDSASKLNLYELEALIKYLYELGFKVKSKYKKPKLVQNKGRLDKIEALLAEKGRVEGIEIPWEYALGILKKMTKGKKERLELATSKELDNIIYALINDAKRKGRYYSEWNKEVNA